MTFARRAGGVLGCVLLLCCGSTLAQSASVTMNVSATVLSNNNCRLTTYTPNTLSFTLNPASAVNTSSNTLTWQFRCNGSDATVAYLISASLGASPSGSTRRMRMGTTGNYLPYTLAISPASGTVNKNTFTNFTLQASVLGGDFANAAAGSYADAVTVSIAP